MSNPITWEVLPPQIYNDSFFHKIIQLVQDNSIQTILDIGASSGEGSSFAFYTGMQGTTAKLFCLEACRERFDRLYENYKDIPNVFTYNMSSVKVKEFPTVEEVKEFYSKNPDQIQTVLSWLEKDIKYIHANSISQDGIETIKKEHSILNFDCVLIDGSEFTGNAELNHVIGAKFILLDDINSFKNATAHERLLNDPNYCLLEENRQERNGFSIFKRITNSA